MDPDHIIALLGITIPVIVTIMGFIIKGKNDEIKLLETKNDSQEAIITELKIQNMKLEVTGVLVNKFFSEFKTPLEVKGRTDEKSI